MQPMRRTTLACNCSNTNFILSSGQTVNFTSPGYPSMLCPSVSCQYNIQMKTPAPNNVNYKNAFLVKTVYLSQEGNDQLNFQMGKETFALEKFGPDNLNVFVGESLDVLYRAFSVFSANHGFQMRIEAIQLPLGDFSASLIIYSYFRLPMSWKRPQGASRQWLYLYDNSLSLFVYVLPIQYSK